jgi:rhodanese-related sulfurtransferase
MIALVMVWLAKESVAQLDPKHANHYAMLHYSSDCNRIVVPGKVPLDPRVEILDAHAVQQCLSSRSCILVDVRGKDRESGTIAGAEHVPQHDIGTSAGSFAQKWATKPLVVFHCQFSAHRAPGSANAYLQSARAGQRVAIMQGGFNEWKCMGLPVNGVLKGDPFRCTLPGCDADGEALRAGLDMAASTPFNVNDKVYVWSKSNNAWFADGKVVSIDHRTGKLTVRYNTDKMKELPFGTSQVSKSFPR